MATCACKVLVRVRPITENDPIEHANVERTKESVVEVEKCEKGKSVATTITVNCSSAQTGYGFRSPHGSSSNKSKQFIFDAVHGPDSTQEDIFDSVHDIVSGVLDGYNATLMAYGQTGSGKTHTIFGNSGDDNEAGIVPRSLRSLFLKISADEFSETDVSGSSFTKRTSTVASFFEIFNENVFDLLNTNTESKVLNVREDLKRGVYVDGLKEVKVRSAEEAEAVLSLGLGNRQVAATMMNSNSSRSHSVFMITLKTIIMGNDGDEKVKVSKFTVVDLAGSERQKSAGTVGSRLREASSINSSLSVLANVIGALADKESGRERYVPYRDSKLTFILRDSWGGNSKSCLLATISPDLASSIETLSTLNFARRAKTVRNMAQKALLRSEAATVVDNSISVDMLRPRTPVKMTKKTMQRWNPKHQEKTRLKSMEEDLLNLKTEKDESVQLIKSLEEDREKLENQLTAEIEERRAAGTEASLIIAKLATLENQVNQMDKERNEEKEKACALVNLLEEEKKQLEEELNEERKSSEAAKISYLAAKLAVKQMQNKREADREKAGALVKFMEEEKIMLQEQLVKERKEWDKARGWEAEKEKAGALVKSMEEEKQRLQEQLVRERKEWDKARGWEAEKEKAHSLVKSMEKEKKRLQEQLVRERKEWEKARDLLLAANGVGVKKEMIDSTDSVVSQTTSSLEGKHHEALKNNKVSQASSPCTKVCAYEKLVSCLPSPPLLLNEERHPVNVCKKCGQLIAEMQSRDQMSSGVGSLMPEESGGDKNDTQAELDLLRVKYHRLVKEKDEAENVLKKHVAELKAEMKEKKNALELRESTIEALQGLVAHLHDELPNTRSAPDGENNCPNQKSSDESSNNLQNHNDSQSGGENNIMDTPGLEQIKGKCGLTEQSKTQSRLLLDSDEHDHDKNAGKQCSSVMGHSCTKEQAKMKNEMNSCQTEETSQTDSNMREKVAVQLLYPQKDMDDAVERQLSFPLSELTCEEEASFGNEETPRGKTSESDKLELIRKIAEMSATVENARRDVKHATEAENRQRLKTAIVKEKLKEAWIERDRLVAAAHIDMERMRATFETRLTTLEREKDALYEKLNEMKKLQERRLDMKKGSFSNTGDEKNHELVLEEKIRNYMKEDQVKSKRSRTPLKRMKEKLRRSISSNNNIPSTHDSITELELREPLWN